MTAAAAAAAARSVFHPMTRTSGTIEALQRLEARRLDGVARVLQQGPKLRPDSGDDDERFLRGRSVERVLYNLGLGMTLFSCPTVIMAYINHWMSWDPHLRTASRLANASSARKQKPGDGDGNDHDDDDDVEAAVRETFDKLCDMILNDNPSLYLVIQRRQDLELARTVVTFDLGAFSYDVHYPSDYALSSDVISASLRSSPNVEEEEEEGDVRPEWRFRAITAYMLADVSEAMFATVDEHIDGRTFTLRSFDDNDALLDCYDRSAFFIALGVFIATYLDQALAAKDDDNNHDPRRTEAEIEAGKKLMGLYGDCIMQIRERSVRILNLHGRAEDRATRDETSFEVYDSHASDEDQRERELVQGIPLRVLRNETLTLLWLHWAWAKHVVLEGRPTKQLLSDLWAAKSAWLAARYHTFFQGVSAHEVAASSAADVDAMEHDQPPPSAEADAELGLDLVLMDRFRSLKPMIVAAASPL